MKEFLFENCFAIVGVGLLIFAIGVCYFIYHSKIDKEVFYNEQHEDYE